MPKYLVNQSHILLNANLAWHQFKLTSHNNLPLQILLHARLTHAGLEFYLCAVENNTPYFPSDAYMRRR